MHPKSVSKARPVARMRQLSKPMILLLAAAKESLQLGPEGRHLGSLSLMQQQTALPRCIRGRPVLQWDKSPEVSAAPRRDKARKPQQETWCPMALGRKLTETQVCICREEGCPDWISEVGAPRQADAQKEFRVLQVRAVGDVTQHDRGANIGICLDLSQVGSLRLMEAPILHIALVNTRIVRGYSPSRSVSVTRCRGNNDYCVETNDVSKAEIPVLRLEVVDWRNKHGRN
ncbi:hypothetical protein KCU84_g4, partial [Aureobasidium melanogenum]